MTGVAMLSVEEARRLVAETARPLPIEQVALTGALGRYLAEDVVSERDLPPFDSSAMDGYAVPPGASGRLTLVGESRAGHPAGMPLGPGEAMPISTGAMLPPGTGAVAEIEIVDRQDGLLTLPAIAAGRNLRRAGEDVRAGEQVLAVGTRLGPPALAILAALGRARVPCRAVPRVAILVTGDELVDPGAQPEPGQIVDSNRIALGAQATAAGARVVQAVRVGDDRDATAASIADALERADVLCISGGVSVGEHDHVRPALEALGVTERFWRVRLKPGKPTWFGSRGRTLVFALPGNPVSAMVTFELFARPALIALQGGPTGASRTRATLEAAVERAPGRTQAVRVSLRLREDGYSALPTGPQGSHRISSMLAASALALIEPGEGRVEAGERVDIELLAAG